MRARADATGQLADTVYVWKNWPDALLFAVLSGVWWLITKLWTFWVALAVSTWAGMATGHLAVGIGVLLLLLYGIWWLRRFRKPGKNWYDHGPLVQALVDAEILTKVKPNPTKKRGKATSDPSMPSLSMRGNPIHSEYGTTRIVGLPQARTLSDVVARRERLAAAMRIPQNRLEVTQDSDDPSNVVRIRVSTGNLKEYTAEVVGAERTRWHDPVCVAHDTRGERVELGMHEHNTLVAGVMGYGKTSMARIPLAHTLLDPEARVWLLDGKGSLKDYGAIRTLCEQYIRGTDESAVEDTLAMFGEVLELVRERNSTHEDQEFPGALLFLEEYQDIRAAATKEDRAELDLRLGRIERMGRAVSVHVLISTQRPTADDVPTGARNIIDQRYMLRVSNSEDAKLALGVAPYVRMPKARREAIFGNAAGQWAVVTDGFNNEQWKQVVARAAKLRGVTNRPALALVRDTGDPLLAAVLEILMANGPGAMTSSEIHAKLPDWARTAIPTAQALGTTLNRFPDSLERKHIGNRLGWVPTARAWARLRSESVS